MDTSIRDNSPARVTTNLDCSLIRIKKKENINIRKFRWSYRELNVIRDSSMKDTIVGEINLK